MALLVRPGAEPAQRHVAEVWPDAVSRAMRMAGERTASVRGEGAEPA